MSVESRLTPRVIKIIGFDPTNYMRDYILEKIIDKCEESIIKLNSVESENETLRKERDELKWKYDELCK